MHSGLAKEYGQCLLKVISKGVENSKKIIANGILVTFLFLFFTDILYVFHWI